MQKRRMKGLAVVAVLTASIASTTVLSAEAVDIQVVSNFTSDVARRKALDELIKDFNAQHQGEYTLVSRRSHQFSYDVVCRRRALAIADAGSSRTATLETEI